MDASLRRDPALMAAANPGLPILQPDDTQQPSTRSSGTAEFPRWNDGEPMLRADVCKIQEYEEDLRRQEAEDAERCRDMCPEELFEGVAETTMGVVEGEIESEEEQRRPEQEQAETE